MTIKESGYSPEGQLIETRELKPGISVVLTCDEILPHPKMIGDKIPLTWFEVLEGEDEIAIYRRAPNTLEIERTIVGKQEINGLSLRTQEGSDDPTRPIYVYEWRLLDPTNKPVAIVEPTKDSPIISEEITKEAVRYLKLVLQYKELIKAETVEYSDYVVHMDEELKDSKPGSVHRLTFLKMRGNVIRLIIEHLQANPDALARMKNRSKHNDDINPETSKITRNVVDQSEQGPTATIYEPDWKPRFLELELDLPTDEINGVEKIRSLREQGKSLAASVATVIIDEAEAAIVEADEPEPLDYTAWLERGGKRLERGLALSAYTELSATILDGEEILRTGEPLLPEYDHEEEDRIDELVGEFVSQVVGKPVDYGALKTSGASEVYLIRKQLAEIYLRIGDPLKFVDEVTSQKIKEQRQRENYDPEIDGLYVEGLDRGMVRFYLLYEKAQELGL